ncbi:MAG: hypothetical protein JWM59_309 [Verrucomicrobiales bacterium]|nr:hypothetical protein [Verrucomicrobiales bacterium]
MTLTDGHRPSRWITGVFPFAPHVRPIWASARKPVPSRKSSSAPAAWAFRLSAGKRCFLQYSTAFGSWLPRAGPRALQSEFQFPQKLAHRLHTAGNAPTLRNQSPHYSPCPQAEVKSLPTMARRTACFCSAFRRLARPRALRARRLRSVPIIILDCRCAKSRRVIQSATGITLSQSVLTQAAALCAAYGELREAVRTSPWSTPTTPARASAGAAALLMEFFTLQPAVFRIRWRHRHQEAVEMLSVCFAGVLETDRGTSYEAEAGRHWGILAAARCRVSALPSHSSAGSRSTPWACPVASTRRGNMSAPGLTASSLAAAATAS